MRGLIRAVAGSPVALLAAWTAIDASVGVYLHVYGANVFSNVLLLSGLFLFVISVQRPSERTLHKIGRAPALILLATHLLIGIAWPYRADSPPPPDPFRAFPMAALGVLTAAWLLEKRRGVAAAIAWGLGVVVVLGMVDRAAILLVDAAPTFDVPRIQEAAGQALLHGSDPYQTQVFRAGYPYLPVAAIAAALGSVIGDTRWAVWCGDVLTIVGMLVFARRVGVRPEGRLTAAALWVWWSGGLYIAWQGFPDSILIGLMVIGAAAFAGPRPRRVIGGVAVGLAAATKQFGLGLLPFLLWGSRLRGQAVVASSITAALSILPFALWHPARFIEGAFVSHIEEPARDYALNLINWPGGSVDLPLAVAFALALMYGWACVRNQDDPLRAWLSGSSGILLGAFALNRIAFVNYYAIPLALILLLSLRPAEMPEPSDAGGELTVQPAVG